MKAVLYHAFGEPPELATVADPSPPENGVVVRVEATGLCRSDWHGWQGHDADIKRLPHVPGHELAGEIVAVGPQVKRWRIGDRVTTPFVLGCGDCATCDHGDQHICPTQFQPGFHGWGSYAEFVALPFADENLVALPAEMTSVTAASLGCRLATAYRAVAVQANLRPGDWLVVFGCGGVGLSAVTVAHAIGARVIAVEVRDEPLELAKQLGADATLNARNTPSVAAAVHDLTGGGARGSLDAIGSRHVLADALACLARRGRHVQVGLLAGEDADPRVEMGPVIANELEIVGSHGLQAHAYPGLFEMITVGKIEPTRLLDRTITLAEAPAALAALGEYNGVGVTVITPPQPDA